jgi:tetratricopeptide (TPR) repeat protein
MLTRERIADLAGIITTAAVVGVGYAIGGTIGVGVMAGIGINLSSSIIENGSVKLKEQWVASSNGIRNHDIQQALQRALLKTFTRLETRYFTLGQSHALPKSEQASIRELFKELRRQVQQTFPVQVEQVMQDLEVQEYLYASPVMASDKLWEQINEPALLRTYNEDFKSFLRQNLLHEVQFCFGEELKTETPACTRAWRAFQRMLLEGIQADVQAVQAQQDEIHQDLHTLEVVRRQLDALRDVLHRREPHEPFLHAVETAMNDVRMAVQDVASTTQRTEVKVDAISEYLQQSQQRLVEEMGVTKSALTSFFKILAQQHVPLEDLDAKLREIATHYKTLLERVRTLSADDTDSVKLRDTAETAIYEGDFDHAEQLLNEASARDLAAAQELQNLMTKRLLSAARAKAANGALKMTQLAYATAAVYYHQATALLDQIPEKSGEILGEYLNAWGYASYQAGDYAGATPPYRRALALREQVLGAQHPHVAQSLNNLALLYHAQGRYSEAEPLHQRALVIREQVLGAQHPDVATSLDNLAMLYRFQGRYSEAEPLYQRALAIRQRVQGAKHSDVATTLNNLAVLYHYQGRYSEAEPLHQRALAIRTEVLGAQHPDVAQSLNNLALLYHAQGRYSEAEPLYQRALAIREQVLGAQHPDVATTLHNLAELCRFQRRYNEAELLCQRALALREQVLGVEHPHVATTLDNLAELYRAQGRYNEAEPLYQRVLIIREQVLGARHPNVATTLRHLAELYGAQGRYEERDCLERRTRKIQTYHI